MSDNIPLEIQLEIIKKAPDVKSLLRFRSVSKQWKSFIDSPEFVAAYGSRDTQPHRLLLRYRDCVDPYEVKYVSFVDVENEILTQQQDFAPNGPLLMKQFNYEFVIGSSCGLWCLYSYKTESMDTEMVVIWNPSIRKSVGIVVPRLLNNTSERMTNFGFGVCPSTYDPTIVGISRFFGMNKTWQIGIFTLSSKAWKIIPSSNMPRESIMLKLTTQVVATDGFIFWVAYDRIAANDGVSQYKDLILSFDFITHEFKEVHLPVSIVNQVSLYMSISKLNESLVVSAYTDEVNKIVYDVWMMGEEGGRMTSFTKLFTIDTPDSSITRLLGFRKSVEPIMQMVKKGEQFAALKVYEPCSEHINDLGINGEKGSFFIFPYTETLLLVDHSDCCIISNDS